MDSETKSIVSEVSSSEPILCDNVLEEEAVQIASPPFDNPEGDVILRSSDNVDFRVFKLILSLASPVFKDMFSLPQPAGSEPESSTPIIEISEDSETIYPLLRFCYPVDNPNLVRTNISLIGNVLKAALKYDVQAAITPSREALKQRAQVSRRNAVIAYITACSLKLEEEARATARACLKWPIIGFSVPQLAMISGLDYFHLLDFHSRASEAAVRRVSWLDFGSATGPLTAISPSDHSCSHVTNEITLILGNTYVNSYKWWNNSRSSLSASFKHAPLDFEILTQSLLAGNLKVNPCHTCKDAVLEGWEEAKKAIVAAVDAEVSQIALKISWK